MAGQSLIDRSKSSPDNRRDLIASIELLEQEGIRLIADYIETNDQVSELSELPIGYAQGFLFGKPDTPGVYNIRMAA